jgi:signal peptidase I
MEPTLQDGDIVLLRKADLALPRWLLGWHKKNNEEENIIPIDDIELSLRYDYERQHCNASPTSPGIIQKPPMPLVGNIVVYKDTSSYGNSQEQWCIKRVMALGGQRYNPNATAFMEVSHTIHCMV